jgi:hypothetical protein
MYFPGSQVKKSVLRRKEQSGILNAIFRSSKMTWKMFTGFSTMVVTGDFDKSYFSGVLRNKEGIWKRKS